MPPTIVGGIFPHNAPFPGIGWPGGDIMNACELTAAITALANTIACGRSLEELNLLGVILTQLGDTMFTIAAQREICCGAKT